MLEKVSSWLHGRYPATEIVRRVLLLSANGGYALLYRRRIVMFSRPKSSQTTGYPGGASHMHYFELHYWARIYSSTV